MPAFNTEVPNPLSKEDAVEKLKGFMSTVAEKFKDQISGMESEWNANVLNFAFTAMGFKISGVMTVEEDQVAIQGDLPFAAAMFRGKIESDISKELEKALNK